MSPLAPLAPLHHRPAFASSHQPTHGQNLHSERTGGAVCIANIGPKERRRRLVFGIVTLTLGVVLAAALIMFHLPALWRLLVFLPFAGGAAGLFQWWEKT